MQRNRDVQNRDGPIRFFSCGTRDMRILSFWSDVLLGVRAAGASGGYRINAGNDNERGDVYRPRRRGSFIDGWAWSLLMNAGSPINIWNRVLEFCTRCRHVWVNRMKLPGIYVFLRKCTSDMNLFHRSIARSSKKFRLLPQWRYVHCFRMGYPGRGSIFTTGYPNIFFIYGVTALELGQQDFLIKKN